MSLRTAVIPEVEETDGRVDGRRTATALTRRRLAVHGLVQGVGFRPFVYGLAHSIGLAGHVGNGAAGVFVDIEGRAAELDEFTRRLVIEQPPLARIDRIECVEIDPLGTLGFDIVESTGTDGPRTLVPPDVATCDDCLAELADPADRRHRYPFVNCTNCGPRFTIIRDLPYDRPATTMAAFEMCPECAAEYHDPTDRRHHAQPIACPACGPQLTFVCERGTSTGTDAVLAQVHRFLAAGRVVALKGLGGYHLVCDATNDDAVELLRTRKGRSDKPFAVMVRDVAAALEIVAIDPIETEVLTSPARPIVLLRRRANADVAPGVAPGNPLLGVMLPYTPLHELLFRPVPGATVEPPRVVVMTSGNQSDEPICFDDDDAAERLADLADAFCTNDRPIEVPCDDSVVRVIDGDIQPIRRSRGYAPVPVRLPFDVPPVLGVGGELKNTCCVAAGPNAWVGQHIGDMENLATLEAFEASVAAFTTMYRVQPVAIGVDRHPAYLTRRWALDRVPSARPPTEARIVHVQHHHAHVAAVMAEHGLGLDDEVLGFAFDGTGFGEADDGTPQIWGGEVLRAGYSGFERVAHLAPLPLPGGDEAVRNPCRVALAYLTVLGIPLDDRLTAVAACDSIEHSVVPRQAERGVGCVPTTSMGRLFDVVSSLLGVRHRVSYEAQAAIELEHLAEAGNARRVSLQFDLLRTPGGPDVIDPRPVLSALVEHLLAGTAPADLAAAFHHAVADAIGRVADDHAGDRPVALTGGTFQNALLTRLVRERLGEHHVLTHRLVPPNDGGLSLGQAVIAAVAMLDVTGERSS
jgi:hydrogenase maturation protein HypF